MKHPSRRPVSAHYGYTLMELVIALGIGVAILLALMLMFSSNSGNQQEVERTLRQIENARFAMDTLAEDVVHAGFYSDFDPSRVTPAVNYTSPLPCALLPADQGWAEPNAGTGAPLQVPRPVEGIPAGTAVACTFQATRRDTTEAIIIRRAETGPAIPIAAARNDNLYIQTSRCRDEWGRVRLAPSPGPFDLLDAACTAGVVNNAVRRLVQRTYYIATCNDCTNNDGIPTLKRVEMINGDVRTTSIAEGIENLQFEFGVDRPPVAGGLPDGVPDEWLTTGAMAAADWPDVVSVRMHLLARSTQRSPGHVETRTFQLGPVAKVDPPASNSPDAGFKRSLLATTVRLNNVGGRRE